MQNNPIGYSFYYEKDMLYTPRPMILLRNILLFLLSSAQVAMACPDVDSLLDVNCDGKVKVVTFGDSITRGVADETGLGYPGRLQVAFPNVEVVNLGVPGENTYNGRSRAANNFATHSDADFIVILEGVNDYFLDSSVSGTRNNLFSMLSSGEGTGAITLLAKLSQVKRSFQKGWVSSVNNAISSRTSIDFYALGESIISFDQLHPNGAGYQSMTNLVGSILITLTIANRPIDSDADGIYDFAETFFGTGVFTPDTDGDGLLDGAEVFTYGSSPLLLDTDGDGFTDPFEVEVGADPGSAMPSAPVIDSVEILDRS